MIVIAITALLLACLLTFVLLVGALRVIVSLERRVDQLEKR